MVEVERKAHGSGHPLAPGAGADAVRAHLLVEDRPRFDAAVGRAEDESARRVTLEEWRCIAIVQHDRNTFVRTARRLAEQNSGEPSPPDEPLAVTRAKAGL